jgi:DNA-binding NarL/FixJ family response regulator
MPLSTNDGNIKPMSKLVRVVIADNDAEFSDNLYQFLERQPDINVIDIVRDGQGAVDACKEYLPDIILMDLRLPVLDTVRAIQTILAQNEHVKILGMSSITNDRYAIEAIKAGAKGFIEKNGDMAYNVAVDAIRQVASGEVLLNPELATGILEEFFRLSE